MVDVGSLAWSVGYVVSVHFPSWSCELLSVHTTPLHNCVVRVAESAVVAPMSGCRNFAAGRMRVCDAADRRKRFRCADSEIDLDVARVIPPVDENILSVEADASVAGRGVDLIEVLAELRGHPADRHARLHRSDGPRTHVLDRHAII